MLLKIEQQWYENTKMCYICKENFEDKYIENKILKTQRLLPLYRNTEVLHIAYII